MAGTVSSQDSSQMIVSEMPIVMKNKTRCLDGCIEILLPKSLKLQSVYTFKRSKGLLLLYGRATVLSSCCLVVLPFHLSS